MKRLLPLVAALIFALSSTVSAFAATGGLMPRYFPNHVTTFSTTSPTNPTVHYGPHYLP